ncbi:crystallin [Sorangium cellulosum]|uniref:Crystallin n=1 Tax=Sorangium cellulosum TaxID=56 RepID=A0A2L0EUB5_SORCE|nr:inositol monophosphatase family protein [Sorangium cellulosum]AUX42869.1 crystallin [Sorangium cellulosum]
MGYDAELAVAVEAARRAGALLRAEFHRPGGPRGAGTHADIDVEVEVLLREALTRATPHGFLGEETGAADGADPSHRWVVDPNDGTASFLHGYRGASVSIGLLRGNTPVLGVVFAYAYPDDDGDLIAWAEGTGPIQRNGAAVSASLAGGALDRYAVVLLSQSADYLPARNARCVAPARFLALPSLAYRLALAAVGEAVAAVSLSRPRSWDYAAGHALVRAAGGELVDDDGAPVDYTAAQEGELCRVFGGAPAAVRELARRPWNAVVHGRVPAPQGTYGLLRPSRSLLARGSAGALARAQGCLLGQLAGDALGALVEFKTAEDIARRYPGGVRDLADGGTWDTLAGQPTDDSEMALMLARSIVRKRGFVADAALDAYVHWYGSRPFDIGNTTAAALRAAAGAPLPSERLAHARAGASWTSQANGSVMRAAPLGLLGAGRPREAAAWARDDSALTHPHPVCCASSAAFVAAVAAAVGGAGVEGAFAAALAQAEQRGERAVIDALAAARRAPPPSASHHAGWVLIALQNAFYQLLHAPSLEQGLVATVMAGGDTDTNAAIAGALLGAAHGRDAVPARFRRLVLTCRPLPEAGAKHRRPPELWPVDAMLLAEALLASGR